MPGLVAGIECAARLTRVLVVDPADGRAVAETSAPHAVLGLGHTREGDADSWWGALGEALRETQWCGDIEAVSVVAPHRGLVMLDGLGRAARLAILDGDQRAAREAAELIGEMGGPAWWAKTTGSLPVASSAVAIWCWLARAEPELLARVRALRLPHDFLVERLIGEAVTDRGTASGTGWWSARDGYVQEILSHVGIRAESLPRVLDPRAAAGEVTDRAAHDTGLRRGTLVATGTGSAMAEALALGLDFGTPVLRIDGGGAVFTVAAAQPADASGAVQGFADATGRFQPTAYTANAGLAVERFADWLRVPVEAVAERTAIAVLPQLDGGGDISSSGAVLGLRYDTNAAEILLAVYEGVVATLLELLEAVAGQAGRMDPAAPLILTGEGAGSDAWKRTLGRLSGRPLVVPHRRDLAPLGAAVQAAALLGHESPMAVAKRWETRRGTVVRAVARDEEAVERIRRVRELMRGAGGR